MENVSDLNNWLIALAALGKILSYFWPVVLMTAAFGVLEWRANREA